MISTLDTDLRAKDTAHEKTNGDEYEAASETRIVRLSVAMSTHDSVNTYLRPLGLHAAPLQAPTWMRSDASN